LKSDLFSNTSYGCVKYLTNGSVLAFIVYRRLLSVSTRSQCSLLKAPHDLTSTKEKLVKWLI